MIEHIVYFKANPGQEENLTKTLAEFAAAMKPALPGLIEISTGVNFNPRTAEFTHALASKVDSRETLQAYAVHPIHVELMRQLNEGLSAIRLPLDYEIKA